MSSATGRVGVFVYGDIGRSPRMQNHALQLAQHFKEVFFMGYLQTAPRSQVVNNPNIKFIDLQAKWLGELRKFSYYLYVFTRVIFQVLQILYLLIFKVTNLKFILIQNPPSVPNLMAIWIASFIRRYKIYIDFHNYGYTILALNVKNSIVLKLAKIYQKFFGKRCQRAFCVSNKMKKDLKDNWGIQATALYDRPLGKVRRQVDRQGFFRKYYLEVPQNTDLVCVSSTSWTKDQDFSILLEAVSACDQQLASLNKRLKVYITGKGPEKQFYLKKITQMRPSWKSVSIDTVWLDADDYPVLLSLCDFGVCLHCSSSGLDLPMKVVDMFEAGLPVLAVNYDALNELVKETKNGFVFNNKDQLKQRILQIVKNQDIIKKLKENVIAEKEHSWGVQWKSKFMEKS